ncbi:putative Elongin-A, partial [Xylogone sp. PMI_703]
APSLIDLCTRACIKNVRALVDVGDFEYWKLRTILQRVDSAEQLHQIELNSPQIQGEDAELWKGLIARDIPNWKEKNYVPKNPRKWYEVYCKYKKEHRREVARDEEVLRNTMLGIKKEKETHLSRVVDLRTLPKVPKDPRMAANNGGVPLGRTKGSGRETPSVLTWNAGSKTKMTDGKSVLTRARREAKEISQRSKMVNRTGARPGQVIRAPTGMVNDHRKAAEPPVRILTKRKTIDENRLTPLNVSSLEEREQRLRALTNPSSGSEGELSAISKPTYIGSSDEED